MTSQAKCSRNAHGTITHQSSNRRGPRLTPGGYALQAHHLVERMSEDIDIFTDRWDPNSFAAAVNAVLEAFRQHRFGVEVTRQAETFARLQIIDQSSGQTASMDLAADYRQHQPVILSVGPVLEETDAVAAKVATVFSRALARDYLDLAGILASGRYSRQRLLETRSYAFVRMRIGKEGPAAAC
jgi:predicted nucleotidyltransferase component of viral defense system